MKHFKSHFIIVVALLLLSACQPTQPTPSPELTADTPFAFEETEFDFGIIKQSGGVMSHDFNFAYTGDEPIIITATPGSCLCTEGEISKEQFNPGEEGVLTEERALQVNVGDTVRLYVGNGGVAKVSNFHVIGEIFDKVYVEGGSLINENVQTTLIPAGGSTIVEFTVNQPGKYLLVDHALSRLNKGALAELIAS